MATADRLRFAELMQFLPVDASQTRTVFSLKSAETSVLPSAENATD
jgi:hypothetical protein